MLREPSAGAQPPTEAYTVHAKTHEVQWSEELEELHVESSSDHFLDVWTRTSLLLGIERFGDARPHVILDAGCSSGYLLQDLRAAHPEARLLGVDLIASGLRRAHSLVPDAELLLADVCELPLDSDSVDVALSANLLEHVLDDRRALAEIHRVLRPGGLAGIVVPAGPTTYDYYDEFLGHHRRYDRGEIARKAPPGLSLMFESHIGGVVYPAFWATKKLHRLRHRRTTPEERRRLVERDIARTSSSSVGAMTTRVEQRLFARAAPLPVGIRSLTFFRKA
jgi:SAM-dependent methyltransferase